MPFHSYHIFENPDTKLSDIKAKELIKTLTDFVSLIPIRINIMVVNKSSFKKCLGIKSDEDLKGSSEKKELKESPYRVMASNLFNWFAKYLEENQSLGEIIVDARRGGDYQLVRTLYQCKDNGGPFDEATRKLIKDKCTSICFAEKNSFSGGLEITDILSYTAFQHAKRTISSFDHIKLSGLWNKSKKLLDNKKLHKIEEREIRKFFKIKKDEVHKALKE